MPKLKKGTDITKDQYRLLATIANSSRGQVTASTVNSLFASIGSPISKFRFFAHGIEELSKQKQGELRGMDENIALIKAQIKESEKKKRSLERKGGKLLALSHRREGQEAAATDLPVSGSESEQHPAKRRKKGKTLPQSVALPLPPSFSMQHGESFRRGSNLN